MRGRRHLQVKPKHRVVAIKHSHLCLARKLVLWALRRAGLSRRQHAGGGGPWQLAAHRDLRVAPHVSRHLGEEEVELRRRAAQLLRQLGIAHGTLSRGRGGGG